MKGKWRDREFEITRVGTEDGYLYDLKDVEIQDCSDYWTRLEHQYAGMAMEALIKNVYRAKNHEIAGMAAEIAYALMEKMKEERK